MTFRAVEVLKSVDVILAEDTRTSGFLLKHFEIATRMETFHAHNEHKKLDVIIQRLRDGETMALISDAGTPGISDPGFLLARAAVQNDVRMESLPGPTAFVPALVKSGFPCDRFVFEGFLPHKKGRKTRLEKLKEEVRTVVLYESPYRLLKLLEEIKNTLGAERNVSVSREITKKFEETRTGEAWAVLDYFKSKDAVKGEIVVVIEGTE